MKSRPIATGLGLLFATAALSAAPFRLAVVGLDHGHVDGFLAEALTRPDVKIVAVVEPKAELAASYAARLKVPESILFRSLDEMFSRAHPDGVAVFTSTFDHRRTVVACAEHGVDVMMEKPLAVSLDHARAMAAAIAAHPIKVIVNYETTWYPSHALAQQLVTAGTIGELRKIVVRDGHQGPKEIGCPESFLAWLTDPKLNGGGALMDFGCYGADLATWLMHGQRPLAVTAVTRQLKPAVYPRVDDDATILVSYPQAEAVIQASWNWPFGRKDMDLYGTTGALLITDRDHLQQRNGDGAPQALAPPPLDAIHRDPLDNFIAVVRGEIPPHPLATFATNLIVTEILDAARESASTGRTVTLASQPAR
jgi:predicted dehydrogenase